MHSLNMNEIYYTIYSLNEFQTRRIFLAMILIIWIHNIKIFHFQLTAWLTELRQELRSEEVADTLEGGERLIEQFSTQRDSTLDACASTIGEGKALLEELK